MEFRKDQSFVRHLVKFMRASGYILVISKDGSMRFEHVFRNGRDGSVLRYPNPKTSIFKQEEYPDIIFRDNS